MKKKTIRVKPDSWFDVEFDERGKWYISFYDEDGKVIEIISAKVQIKELIKDLEGY